MSQLTGLNQALDIFVQSGSKALFDQVVGKRPFLAALLATQDKNSMGGSMPNNFVRSDSLTGNEARFTLRTGIPRGRGVRAQTGAIQELVNPYREETTTVTLTASPSYYENDETIRFTELESFTQGAQPNIAPLMETKVVAVMDGLMEAVNDDLFPATNLSPSYTSGTTRGEALEDRIMAVSHPLQTGQDGNAAGVSQSYDYFGYNLGTNSNSQAINLGTYASAATLDLRQIRKEIILPGSTRGTAYDISLCDAYVMDQICDLMEDKIVLANQSDIGFGVTGVELFKGVRLVHEPRLDVMAAVANMKREMLFLNTSTWSFNYVWPEKGKATVDGRRVITIKEPSDSASFYNMTCMLKARLVCLNPRANARIFNPTIA